MSVKRVAAGHPDDAGRLVWLKYPALAEGQHESSGFHEVILGALSLSAAQKRFYGRSSAAPGCPVSPPGAALSTRIIQSQLIPIMGHVTPSTPSHPGG